MTNLDAETGEKIKPHAAQPMVENDLGGTEAGDNLEAEVGIEQVYDLSVLYDIRSGQIVPANINNELGVVSQPLLGEDSLDADSLLLSLGV